MWVFHTVEKFLIVWFNNCVLGNSGQIANPIIVMVDPVLYYIVYSHIMFASLLITNAGTTRDSQLKTDLWYFSTVISCLFSQWVEVCQV